MLKNIGSRAAASDLHQFGGGPKAHEAERNLCVTESPNLAARFAGLLCPSSVSHSGRPTRGDPHTS